MLAPSSFVQIMLTVDLATAAYLLILAIHRCYFHSLSRFPGPRLWAVSRIPYVSTLLKGNLTQRSHELHKYYGPIVRLAPNELSFIDAQAWQDIYSHHQGRPDFPKNPTWMPPGKNGINSILSANDADHARYRRLLAHAFSERALRQQEHILLSYIDLLTSRLRECASSPDTEVVDLVKWFNFTTFDIVGDLALGESFHCLEDSRYHGWVALLFLQFKAAAFIVAVRLVGLGNLLRMLLPRSLLSKRKQHAELAIERIHRRLDQGVTVDAQRNDFMTYILRHNDEKGMSVPEIEETMRVVVAAGSETTATALSAIMGFLLRDPHTMTKLTDEIRYSFRQASEICTERVTELPYLNAVIEEGIRLCSPVALGMPRIVPAGGAEVSGHWLPEGTFVSASGYSSNRSTLNFPNSPSTFDPSRWLLDSSTSTGAGSLKTSTLTSSSSAFNPFSLGPRNCIGRNLAYLEMRLILTHLLWAFDFEADGELVDWAQQRSWVLWEKKPLMVRLKCRS